MSPEDIAKVKQKEEASQQLADIAALRELAAFSRYFIRRLVMKRDQVKKSFEDDPPSKVGHEEREILRRTVKTYDELLGMMAQDQRSSLNILEQS